MGDHICEANTWQGISIYNILRASITKQHNKVIDSKIGTEIECTVVQ